MADAVGDPGAYVPFFRLELENVWEVVCEATTDYQRLFKE